MPVNQKWDTELYEARHGFVWQLGEGVLALLDAKPGERILDLGCGTGQLTQKIAASGAHVLGVDASADMIGQARQNYPQLQFALEDATELPFDSEFDAVFSNAVLHWVRDQAAAAKSIFRALKPNGRFVAEFGGHGNVRNIEAAVSRVIARYSPQVPKSPLYFPRISDYSAVLEAHGFEVRFAQLFDRPTPLEGDEGMHSWFQQFGGIYFDSLQQDLRNDAIAETVEELRPVLYRDGQWHADYRRLRVVAWRP